jgi:hypothetical protein
MAALVAVKMKTKRRAARRQGATARVLSFLPLFVFSLGSRSCYTKERLV